MSYVSLKFLIFVICLMCIYYLFPKKYRWTILLIGNLYFFISLSGKLVIYSVIATLITYIFGLIIDKTKHKKSFLNTGIILVLLFLIVLK